jgi:hypothetical protein
MTDGKLEKMEKDYSSVADVQLPAAEALAKVSFESSLTCQAGRLSEALDSLLVLEKQSRTVFYLLFNFWLRI